MSKLLFSIVIPVLNEEKHLSPCLKAINSQNYDGPVNIIISDNGSTDTTSKISQKFNYSLVMGSKKGNIASARRIGCHRAKKLAKKYAGYEEIIVSTDADTILNSNYLKTAARLFKNPKIVAASGPFELKSKQLALKIQGRTFVRMQYYFLWMLFGFSWLRSKAWNNGYLYGANSLIRRSVYEKIGGWDIRFAKAEDLALTLALLKRGYAIKFQKSLRAKTSLRKFVNHYGQLNLKSFYDYYFKDKNMKEGIKMAKKMFK